MPTEIITALISGLVTLTVAIGTWHFTAKKDRDENKKLVLSKVEELKTETSDVKAVVQQQIATQTLEIKHLTAQVEKHNGVIERVFKLEQAVEDMRVRIG